MKVCKFGMIFGRKEPKIWIFVILHKLEQILYLEFNLAEIWTRNLHIYNLWQILSICYVFLLILLKKYLKSTFWSLFCKIRINLKVDNVFFKSSWRFFSFAYRHKFLVKNSAKCYFRCKSSSTLCKINKNSNLFFY